MYTKRKSSFLSPSKTISITSLVSTLVLVALFVGCKSSQKVEDDKQASQTAAPEAPPHLEESPMNFDAQGSDSGKIAGLSTVHFDFDKSALTAETKSALHENAKWLKANKTKVQIEGHCDAHGTIEYNLALGERRAKAVKHFLVSLGVPASRLSVISYGKEKLLALGGTESDDAQNRRANFLPLSK